MTVVQALIAFTLAAMLLTVTPGLDTLMVLRTAAVDGPKSAAKAALGILCGCVVWGVAVALGLAALLTASTTAYTVLKWAGAAYLIWLGANLILRPRERLELETQPAAAAGDAWFRRGLLNNLLNPKIGVFYVTFLPQFTPIGVAPAPFIVLLALIHAGLSVFWFAALIGATAPLKRWLQHRGVVRWLDRVTGGVFMGFGLKLAFDPR